MHRFYLPNLERLILSNEEAHHCRDVLRQQVDDEVEVFDGQGHAVRCRIAEITRHEIRLSPLQHRHTPPLSVRITLAAALIKKNMDYIVQKATELGAAAIVPLLTERTVTRNDRPTRWREIALEACKQCGNNWLPEIAAAQPLRAFLSTPHTRAFDLKLVAALQPQAKPLKTAFTPARTVCVMIGPEGDFTAEEYAEITAAGFRPITLGPLVLRADTAALYALSIVHHELVVHGNVL